MVLAGAPGISPDYYHEYIGDAKVNILFSQTYRLLQQAEAALVTSGTATLEAALFRVPQAVLLSYADGKVVSFLRRHILTVKYISLVNLIANREVVKELVADTMTVEQARAELERILYDKDYRQRMLDGYEYMAARLGDEVLRSGRHKRWYACYESDSSYIMKPLWLQKDHKIVKSDKAGAVIARLSYFIVRTCDIL